MKPRFTAVSDQTAPATQAVRRAASLLKALGDARAELGLTELAETVALSKATVFRLLGALEIEELVVRDGARETYTLGPALVALGTQARRATPLHAAARPILAALAHETGETVTLEVLVGAEVLIIDEIQGRHLVGVSPEVGMRWPAHATSTGKVLLAARDGPVTAGVDGDGTPPLAQVGPNTITAPARLARELADVARVGYATTFEELEPGFAAVGAPVRNGDDRVVAAISVGGPTVRLTRDRLAELAPAVRRAADHVSQRLGAPTCEPFPPAPPRPA
jgi:IclR family transcriptional regulator, acetate operon repressor